MNRIYRKVWNKSLGQLVVASELAASDSPGVRGEGGSGALQPRLLAVAMSVLLFGMSAPMALAQSVEVGGNVDCTVDDPAVAAECAVAGSADASGANAIAVGAQSTASGVNSIALGHGAEAAAARSTAIGNEAAATGAYDIAIGNNARTEGSYGGVAIGGGMPGDTTRQNRAGQFGTAVGFAAQARNVGSTALGGYANTGEEADALYGTAIGYRAFASGDVAVALGTF
ncbi:MAG TPA: hypothetical protein H9827_02880, partial [Candidatus Luteimonas excrementigallinarum]|nr:hypothetical protein [Candidatus Luteimonas excrementigallinarum]